MFWHCQAEIRMKHTPRWLQDRIGTSWKIVARIRRDLRLAVRDKDMKRLERELKKAQIEHAYAQHWLMLT
jgi:hypothetical protein